MSQETQDERQYKSYIAMCAKLGTAPMDFERWVKFTYYRGHMKSQTITTSQENVYGVPANYKQRRKS